MSYCTKSTDVQYQVHSSEYKLSCSTSIILRSTCTPVQSIAHIVPFHSTVPVLRTTTTVVRAAWYRYDRPMVLCIHMVNRFVLEYFIVYDILSMHITVTGSVLYWSTVQ